MEGMSSRTVLPTAWAREKRVPAWLLAAGGGLLVAWNGGLILQWILYPADRQAGLPWDRLPGRVFWEIPRQGVDLLWRLLFQRDLFYENPGG